MLLRASTKKPTRIQVPTLVGASAEFAALKTRIGELETRRDEIDRNLRKIEKGKIPVGLVDHAARGRSERAVALVGDLMGADEPRPPSEASIAEVRELVERLRTERADIEAALAILKLKVSPALAEASRLVCELVRKDYDAAIKRTALTLAAALEAHRNLLHIMSQLSDGDVRWTSHLVQPPNLRSALGEPWDKDTQADRFINEAIAGGFVTDGEIEKAAIHG